MPEVSCKICSTSFYVKPSHQALGYGKYCSINCRNKSQLRGRSVLCARCGKSSWKMPKQLKRSKSGLFFCSKSCQTIWRNKIFSGSRHPFWKGGERAYKNIMIRSGIKMICILCKIKDKRVLAVHHIDKNRQNNDLKNLIWMCHNCHFLVHRFNEKLR